MTHEVIWLMSYQPMSRSIQRFHCKLPESAKWGSPHRWEWFPEVSLSGIQRERSHSGQVGTASRMWNSRAIYHLHRFPRRSRILGRCIVTVDLLTFQSVSTPSWTGGRFVIWGIWLTEKSCIMLQPLEFLVPVAPQWVKSCIFRINFCPHFFRNFISRWSLLRIRGILRNLILKFI
jgi:hypothetical protein